MSTYRLAQHIFDFHAFRCSINADDFVQHVHLDPKPFPKTLGSLQQEIIAVLNRVSYIIGKPAIGKGHIGAFFKDRNVGILIRAPGLGGGTGSAGDSSHDDDSVGHRSFPSVLKIKRLYGL